MSQKHICFITSSLNVGGAERTISYLANWGVNNGYKITIIAYGGIVKYEVDSKIELIKYCKKKKRKDPLSRAIRFISYRKRIRKYIKLNRPTATVCMLYPNVLYVIGCKKYTTIIGAERSEPAYLKNKIKRFVKKRVFSYCDKMIFQSEGAKNYYKKLKIKNPYIVENAVGTEFSYKFDPSSIKERRKCIVAVGTIKAEKDYETLIKAFSLFIKSHSGYCLEIYGKNELGDAIPNLINDLKLNECVTLKGSVSNVLECISDASCFVLSSISEGMPNALIEAMSIGLPCITTDCGYGIDQIIHPDINALLVHKRNIDELSNAMCKIIEDQKYANSISVGGRKIITTNSIESIARQFYNIFCD